MLQIQLRSLTAMDVVAYGGTAAGIGVAVWQYVHQGHTAFTSSAACLHLFNGPAIGMAAVVFVILVSVGFFLPLRQLGSYFHVAMNGMTSTKRIFALLDAPEPDRGDAALPGGGRDLTVTFNAVAYRYADTVAASDSIVDGSVAADGSVNATLIHPRLPSISPIPQIRTLTQLEPPSMPSIPPMWTPTHRRHPLPPSHWRTSHSPPARAR